jgi:hypothetical protein
VLEPSFFQLSRDRLLSFASHTMIREEEIYIGPLLTHEVLDFGEFLVQ